MKYLMLVEINSFKNFAPCLWGIKILHRVGVFKLYDDNFTYIYTYISDEEAKREKRKIRVKNDTGVSHKKKPQQSGENIHARHGNACSGSLDPSHPITQQFYPLMRIINIVDHSRMPTYTIYTSVVRFIYRFDR